MLKAGLVLIWELDMNLGSTLIKTDRKPHTQGSWNTYMNFMSTYNAIWMYKRFMKYLFKSYLRKLITRGGVKLGLKSVNVVCKQSQTALNRQWIDFESTHEWKQYLCFMNVQLKSEPTDFKKKKALIAVKANIMGSNSKWQTVGTHRLKFLTLPLFKECIFP